jgi:quercetin dioxygenase-like cupin family protein
MRLNFEARRRPVKRRAGMLYACCGAAPPTLQGAFMLDRTDTKFSHVKLGDTDYVSGGLRDFFLYRDLGIAEATNGKVIAHLVKANMAPEAGTGWHRHEADFQIVIMVKGWARFMYEDQVTLVEAGDVVHQRPGIRHYLFDYSPDMEYLEIVSPADFKSVDVEPVCEVPAPTPWA